MGAILTYGTGPVLDMSTTRKAMDTMGERRSANLAWIARTHARCTTLSDSTRAYFAALAERGTITGSATDEAHDAYFEAAASCATRGAQSMDRRRMLADLNTLRNADLAGEAIGPQVHTYPVVIAGEVEGTLTVTRGHDGAVTTDLDADLAALD